MAVIINLMYIFLNKLVSVFLKNMRKLYTLISKTSRLNKIFRSICTKSFTKNNLY